MVLLSLIFLLICAACLISTGCRFFDNVGSIVARWSRYSSAEKFMVTAIAVLWYAVGVLLWVMSLYILLAAAGVFSELVA